MQLSQFTTAIQVIESYILDAHLVKPPWNKKLDILLRGPLRWQTGKPLVLSILSQMKFGWKLLLASVVSRER